MKKPLSQSDPAIAELIAREAARQEQGIELIASENYVSPAVLEAVGSILTNKYAEGYPGKRYYGGCEFVDDVERLAVNRCRGLFGADHANVQPHSGSQANDAALAAILEPGDTILSLDFTHGGHLTHGHPLSFSGKRYRAVHYGVDPETETIDYAALLETAQREKPRAIICGASAYPRAIDFARMREAADACGAYLVADIAHIAGLVATGLHESPFPHADIVTTTTHKTLRGPRGGVIMCKQELAAAVDRAVFPGAQGGPLMHVIAGKAVCFLEAMQPEFYAHQQQVLANAREMAGTLQGAGLRVVSGGTDTHLLLVDLSATPLTGADAESLLQRVSITVNKNTVPFDKKPPRVASGIRIGTPAITTRGMGTTEAHQIGELVARTLLHPEDEQILASAREAVRDLTARFPLA
jgi:glycine hydroxymethyltransferase